MKKLIITADDFGYSAGRNKGIVACFKEKVISRASLLVNGAQASEAVQQANQHHIPLGLHLNLTEGLPVSDPNVVSSLVDPCTKSMLGKIGFREALRLGNLNMEQVMTEITAQMEKFFQLTQKKPVFVDGHQHIHILPGICEVFAKNDIAQTRLPWEPSVLSLNWIEEPQKKFFSSILNNCSYAVNIFKKNSITFPSHFVGLSTMGKDMSLNRLTSHITAAFNCNNFTECPQKDLVCEVMVHPGYPTDVSQVSHSSDVVVQAGCGTGPDDFDQSKDREHELSVLCSNKFSSWLKCQDIVLCDKIEDSSKFFTK